MPIFQWGTPRSVNCGRGGMAIGGAWFRSGTVWFSLTLGREVIIDKAESISAVVNGCTPEDLVKAVRGAMEEGVLQKLVGELRDAAMRTPPPPYLQGVKRHVLAGAWVATYPGMARLTVLTLNLIWQTPPRNGVPPYLPRGLTVTLTIGRGKSNQWVVSGARVSTSPSLVGEYAVAVARYAIASERVGIIVISYEGVPSLAVSRRVLSTVMRKYAKATLSGGAIVGLDGDVPVMAGPPAGHLRGRDYVIIVGGGGNEVAEDVDSALRSLGVRGRVDVVEIVPEFSERKTYK